jgi:signal transduction histidine kinase
MHLRSVRLLDPVCTIVEIMEPLLMREKRTVEIHVPDTLCVMADDLRFRQVLLNLIGNALKYSPAPQGIAISAESLTYEQLVERVPTAKQSVPLSAQQRYVVVALRDWGPGIALKDQQRLFTKFMRLNRAINSTQRGAGLGLYLCRQLTEAMHGYIWMESEGIPGEGSTFYVALPQGE